MEINKEIFREYDIRGIFGKEINKEVFREIGKAFGSMLVRQNLKKITLGRDCRLSSDNLKEGILAGLIESGIDVIDLSVIPTPLLYFSIHHLNTDGGVMITGSHNPPDYNGVKLCVGKSTIYGEQIQEIRRICEKQDFVQGVGSYTKKNIVEPYIDYVTQNIKIGDKKIKVVVDAGNGTGGEISCKILEKLGISYIPLYCTMDGNFPNHHPDPTVSKNLTDCINRVLSEKADLGIAYDGDADRIGAVSEKGEIIWGDELLIIFSREILSRIPNAIFISEVKSSQALYDDVKKHGGQIIMWKTGHSLIKNKMKEVNAALAGEMSGHIFFKERYFGFDDAIYSSMRLIEIATKTKYSVSELLSDIPKSFKTPEIRVDWPDASKFEVVSKVKDYFKKRYEVIDVDGARILYPNGWGLIRASNTQPVLVLRFEADSEANLEVIKKEVFDELEKQRTVYGG